MWGMGSTLVVLDKRRGESVDGSEAEQLLGGSPGGLTFGGARERVRGGQGLGWASHLWACCRSSRRVRMCLAAA